MTPHDAFQLQPQTVHNTAAAMARSKTGVARWFLWIGGFFVFAIIAMALDRGNSFSPSTGQSTSELVGGGLFWVALLGAIGAVFIRKGKRIKAIGETALASPNLAWWLNGNLVVAVEQGGAPRPDLSFKINDKLRTMLTTVPHARALPFER